MVEYITKLPTGALKEVTLLVFLIFNTMTAGKNIFKIATNIPAYLRANRNPSGKNSANNNGGNSTAIIK